MSTLIVGAGGLLGPHLLRAAAARGPATGLARGPAPADLPWIAADATRDPAMTLAGLQPRLIVFNAALSDPAQCEREPALSRATNAEAPTRWARHASGMGVDFVFISTDLVFDGTRAPYAEDAPVSPLSVYGRDKHDGELGVTAAHRGALVLRLPLLMGLHPQRGLILPLLRALQERRPTPLFTDEFRAPLSCTHAASGVLELAGRAQGLLHLCGATTISRYHLGLRIAAHAGLSPSPLKPCLRADLDLQPPRPGDLTLDARRARTLGFDPGSFDQQLARLVDEAQK